MPPPALFGVHRKEIGMPGEYPFTRGVYPLQYQYQTLMAQQGFGYGLPEDTRKRYEYLSEKGMVGFHGMEAPYNVGGDMPTISGLDPDDPESNRIFNVWIDGYGIPTNGSVVGYETAPFAEQTIVHGGSQSMPLYYDNSVGYSEATLTLTYPRDWTENGVNKLTIWFRGNSDNAAETLYVALNGNAIITHDNPNAAQIGTWIEWNIDLQAFADQGVNLANVNTIAIGLGNRNNPLAGGSGTMYFDDIRLYPPPPEPTP